MDELFIGTVSFDRDREIQRDEFRVVWDMQLQPGAACSCSCSYRTTNRTKTHTALHTKSTDRSVCPHAKVHRPLCFMVMALRRLAGFSDAPSPDVPGERPREGKAPRA